MACGCPVISSNVSSMPEVAGEAAILVDPLSVTEIRAAMVRVLTDNGQRDKMMEAGLKQAATFSWKRCAGETVSLLRTVAGES
jgi:glycosyltransferase involved in cell wall biosynthesis